MHIANGNHRTAASAARRPDLTPCCTRTGAIRRLTNSRRRRTGTIPAIYARAEADPEGSGPSRRRASTGSSRGTGCWIGTPRAKWFVGAEVNASYNCVDRHLETWRRNKAAIIFEGEPGDTRVLTYRDLYREVNRCAAALRRLGVKKGDRVAIYLGMIPELPIAMLACARIGATHTVIFAGFSADSIADRVNDCGATLRDHRRRRLAARQQDPAQRHDGPGAGEVPDRQDTCSWSIAPTTPRTCR